MQQLISIYRTAVKQNKLTVTILPIQQQQGKTGCGLFCIAAAYHFAVGHDLSVKNFSQDEMREHLADCFEMQQLLPFPECHSGTVYTKKHSKELLNKCLIVFFISFQLYCYCITDLVTHLLQAKTKTKKDIYIMQFNYNHNACWLFIPIF